MNLLFWNLKQNDNAKLIVELIRSNDIDVALFAEHNRTNFSSVCSMLGGKYEECCGYGGCEKITMVYKKAHAVTVSRESTRYALYLCNINSAEYIITGIHLPANPTNNADDRKNVIRDIVHDVNELERQSRCNNTIIIGDFNASPFDSELTQKDAFNAVLYKDLIDHSEFVTSHHKRYRRFFNPMLHYISETSKMYGSFYYTGSIDSLYWYCLDQVIVRKPLSSSIDDIFYPKTVGSKRLTKRSRLDTTISDHLPLVVKMKG